VAIHIFNTLRHGVSLSRTPRPKRPILGNELSADLNTLGAQYRAATRHGDLPLN
jgi:hypothetical protein